MNTHIDHNVNRFQNKGMYQLHIYAKYIIVRCYCALCIICSSYGDELSYSHIFHNRRYYFQNNLLCVQYPGYIYVAERILYFCLAHKLIWPWWSSHIFTQWGWLILFSPDHFPGQDKNGENPPNYLFLSNHSSRMDVLSVCSLHSSRITIPWGKPSNLWTSWVYPLRPRVPSWIWIRCM